MDKDQFTALVATKAAEAAAGQVGFWLKGEENDELLTAAFDAVAAKLEKLAEMYRQLAKAQ